MHGLSRSLLANMVTGVTDGYRRVLEISGVGFRASREGKNIILQVGFSHPIRVVPPEGVTFEVIERRSANEPQQVIIRGINKQTVGEEAAKLRGLRPPRALQGLWHPLPGREGPPQGWQDRQDQVGLNVEF